VRATSSALLGLGLAVLAAGCKGEDKGPKGYPVSGKVVFKNGDLKKLVGGYVRLESVSDAKLKAVGEIQEDGTFVMGSFVDGKPVGGVPEGEYRGRVDPPGSEKFEGDDTLPPPKKGELLTKYLRFPTSELKYTIAPGENTITVEVEAKR